MPSGITSTLLAFAVCWIAVVATLARRQVCFGGQGPSAAAPPAFPSFLSCSASCQAAPLSPPAFYHLVLNARWYAVFDDKSHTKELEFLFLDVVLDFPRRRHRDDWLQFWFFTSHPVEKKNMRSRCSVILTTLTELCRCAIHFLKTRPIHFLKWQYRRHWPCSNGESPHFFLALCQWWRFDWLIRNLSNWLNSVNTFLIGRCWVCSTTSAIQGI